MKKLNVPLYLQDDGSMDCGPTCTKMILAYYGIEKSLSQLQKELKYDEVGTTIYDNGNLLLTEGLKTTAITAQPLLFSPDTIVKLKNTKDILALLKLKEEQKFGSLEKDKWILETMKKYLKNKGDIKLEIPAFKHLKKAIDDNNPVLVLMYAKSVGSNEGAFHFVVVCGYKDNYIYVNNPSSSSIKQGWYPIDEFLYGVHASTCVTFDNGTFLVVSK